MADFNIRTDAVDVEQIMRQIRARIQDKRGVDYTEQQIQELASVKLERFLDPKGVRSDLVHQFKHARDRQHEPFQIDQYDFDANVLYGSPRALIRLARKVLNPILKLFFSAPVLIQVLHKQSEMNKAFEKQLHKLREERDAVDGLYYELVHNLVLELTRVGIENRNLKMKVESLSSRLDFDERRARALEGVVQFRPNTGPSREPAQPQLPRPSFAPAPTESPASSQAGVEGAGQGASSTGESGTESGTARRRRRRRRGRRGGRGRPGEVGTGGTVEASSPELSSTPPHGDPTADAALDDSDSDTEPEGGDMGPDEGPDSTPQ
jgi:hypothetical protein